MARKAASVLTTACAIDLARVETEAGRFLGHVFDLRCQWQPGDRQSSVGEVIFGRRGLLERLGLAERKPDSVWWSAVRSVGDGVIVVTGEAARKRRRR